MRDESGVERPISPSVKVAGALLPPGVVASLEFGFGLQIPTPVLILIGIAYVIVLAVAGFASAVHGELTSRWTPIAVEVVDGTVRRFFSRYDRSLRQYALATYGHIDSKGLLTLGPHTFTLDEVFVSLYLDPTSSHGMSADPINYGNADTESNASIWHWYDRARRAGSSLVIIGPPGSGKTTLLRHMATTFAKERRMQDGRRLLPLVISLRDYGVLFHSDTEEPLLATILRYELRDLPTPEPAGYIYGMLSRGGIVVMLDGMDELADASVRARASRWIDRQRVLFPEAPIVVTSRPGGYKSNPLSNATVVQVSRFSNGQIEQFVSNWYGATALRGIPSNPETARHIAASGCADLLKRIRDNGNLYALAANPLLLTMMCNVHHYRGALPGSRLELYKELCEVLLSKRHEARSVAVALNLGQRLVILQSLAFDLMSRSRRDWSVDDVTSNINSSLERLGLSIDIGELLQLIEASSGLIVQREEGVFCFAHLSFQEYMASVYMRESAAPLEVIPLSEAWWSETLLLYAGQGESGDLIERLLHSAAGDLGVLGLAVACMREARTVSAGVRATIQDILNPPDYLSSREARILAGLVRIYLREREFQSYSNGAQICPIPVSKAEFAVFLEEQVDPRQFLPDHWGSVSDALSLPSTPIAGIRPLTAAIYAQWYSARIASEHRYRLPFRSELGDGFKLVTQGPGASSVRELIAIDDVNLSRGSFDAPYTAHRALVRDPEGLIQLLLNQASADSKRTSVLSSGAADDWLAKTADDCRIWTESTRAIAALGGAAFSTDLVDMDSIVVRVDDLVGDIEIQNLSLLRSPSVAPSPGSAIVDIAPKVDYLLAVLSAATATISIRHEIATLTRDERDRVFEIARLSALNVSKFLDNLLSDRQDQLTSVDTDRSTDSESLRGEAVRFAALLGRVSRIYAELAHVELWGRGELDPYAGIVLARSEADVVHRDDAFT